MPRTSWEDFGGFRFLPTFAELWIDEHMKTKYLIPLVAFVVGCNSTATHTPPLTPDKAGSLAQQLANEKAQALYHCQPFQKTEPAQFIDGHWVWHQIQGQGKGDLEARIEFKPDGADPKITLTRLESIPIIH